MRPIEASIIIRTLNEARYLPFLLEAIDAQHSEFGCEVIVVDSGSTDGTLEIAYSHGCRILTIARKEFSFGRSLNLGCKAAIGNYLVIISGHCVPCHGSWLQRLVTPLAEGVVSYTYGRQLGGTDTHWSEHRIFAKYFPEQSVVPQPGIYCNNANSAILRSAWERYQFDEQLTGLEDIHMAQRLVADGGKVGYVAQASAFHYHHENWPQVQRRFEREAVALQRIQPELIVRKRDLFRYLVKGVTSDLHHARTNCLPLHRWPTVWQYRLAQYWGSYIGNRRSRELSARLRESYFYPTEKKGRALEHIQIPTQRNSVSIMSEITSQRIVALLPMKAHSARVSGKNFRDFCGKPLFRWILDTLLEVEEIDLIVINTDAKEILKQNGLYETSRILIHDRPSEICGDFVSMNKIIADDISNVSADIYLMTHTTNPLLSKDTIRKAINAYKIAVASGESDSLFTVDRIQTRFYKRDGTPINHDPNNLLRTQDLEPWYEENSNLYIFNKDSFLKTNARIGDKPHLFVTPKYESVDIDEPEDWDFAVAVKRHLLGKSGSSSEVLK
jgi:rhamnosyltransferase